MAKIKVVSHKRRSKWHSPTFTIRGMSREDISLIMSFAEDGLAADAKQRGITDTYQAIWKIVREIGEYVNADEMVRSSPLEIDS